MGESSGAEGRSNKRLKAETKEDRISALPDSLIHHILSFLPYTEEAIQTGILSRRWKNQWTRLPVLIFSSGMPPLFSMEDLARFIDRALLQHNCSRIKKLHLAYNFENDVNFSSKLTFAITKNVVELILDHDYFDPDASYLLPKFLLDNASLIKLELHHCYFMDTWNINWGSLKAFTMTGYISKKLVANVLSGSPSLEVLELHSFGEGDYVIASNFLKIIKIVIVPEDDIYTEEEIRISCPNLEELYIEGTTMSDNAIANVVSVCPLLRLLELNQCCFDQLVIASKSLKKLVLKDNTVSPAIEISCPNLEEFNFCGSTYKMFGLLSFPCVISATLDFEFRATLRSSKEGSGGGGDVSKQILDQLQNVKELTIGRLFIKILSDLEMGGLYYSWSNNKILTLDRPNFEHLPGIMCALRSSPMLERLVIKLRVYKGQGTADLLDLNDPRENCWNSNRIVSNSLVSHLRTIKIIGLFKDDAKCKLVVDFVEFLLKNAGALEKLVLIISKEEGTDFALAISQKVSSFPRCSPPAIVELLRPEYLEM